MRNYLFYIVFCLAFASCIRDEIQPCPPLQVRIAVKDKNYFNIHEVARLGYAEKLAEDLPFREYVRTLYYVLTDAGTGEVVVEQPLMTLTSGDAVLPVSFPQEMPFGEYVLTVWGNMQSMRPLADDATASELHLYNAEGNDVYVSTDTLLYDVSHFEYQVELERVKGKLIVEAENLPDHIDYSTKEISNVYAYITASLQYGRETSVRTDTLWQEPNRILTETLLCPSTDIDASTLSVNFYATGRGLRAESSPNWIAPEDVQISMLRNTITILRYVYVSGGTDIPNPPDPGPGPDEPDPDEPDEPDNPDNPDPDNPNPDFPDIPEEPDPSGDGNSKFKLYIFINDNWETDHEMGID